MLSEYFFSLGDFVLLVLFFQDLEGFNTGGNFFFRVLPGFLFCSGVPQCQASLFGFLDKAAVKIDKDFGGVKMIVADFDVFTVEI